MCLDIILLAFITSLSKGTFEKVLNLMFILIQYLLQTTLQSLDINSNFLKKQLSLIKARVAA